LFRRWRKASPYLEKSFDSTRRAYNSAHETNLDARRAACFTVRVGRGAPANHRPNRAKPKDE